MPLSSSAPTPRQLSMSAEDVNRLEQKHSEMKQKYTLKKYAPMFATSDMLIAEARRMLEFIPQFNLVKSELDAAYKSGDVNSFKEAYKELTVITREFRITETAQRVKGRRKMFKLDVPLKNQLVSHIDAIMQSLKQGQSWINQQGLSPQQRQQRAQQSARMKARWMEF